MFTINDFDGKEKVVKGLETIKECGGTQLRIYDLSTGIYSRILPQTDGTYAFAESGISPQGFLNELYGFTEDLDIDDDIELYEQILCQINTLNLTSDEVGNLLTNGFLNTISHQNPQANSISGFKELLTAEQLANEIEQSGNVAYQNVLDEINRKLSMDKITDEQRKVLVAMKNVYENDFFKQVKENSVILQEQQRTNDEMHKAQEITEDLLEIGKLSDKEEALHALVETKEKEQNITYDILGFGPMSKETIIYCIKNNSITLKAFLGVIKKDEDIRQVALKKLSEMSEKDIEFWGYEGILDSIADAQKTSEERN